MGSMKVTKLEHACLILDNNTTRLIVDPGSFTNLPEDLSNINCLVITEEHADHYNLENVKKVLAQNPGAKIITTEAVASALKESGIQSTAIKGSAEIEVGRFKLRLIEGDHAVIYGQSPCRVLTLRVDDFLYYPSDSFIPTDIPVQVLALPTAGPWHKVSESIDLAKKVSSTYVLATHNGLYNQTGHAITNNFTSSNVSGTHREYIFLDTGESKEFST